MSEIQAGDILARIGARASNIKHPFLVILAFGLIVRFVCMSLSIGYDADYWAVVIRNLEAGDGLYDAEGYYYTPVWGYILGLISAFQTVFLDLGESAVRVLEAFFVEGLDQYYLSATATSLAFNYSVKLPLVICDLILALLVRHLARDVTGDDRKANLAFALTFLCPVLIGSTCVIGMPDTIAAMFTVLTVILLRRNMPFLAGMTFSLAVLTKFFPAFLIFVFLAYIVVRNRGDRRVCSVSILQAVLGAGIATVVVFLPQILEGDLSQCFQFLTDRTGSSEGETLVDLIIGQSRVIMYVVVLIGSVIIAYLMARSHDGNPDDMLMKGCLVVVTLCLVYPPTTQYIVLLVPFLAYWISARDRRFMLSWKILAVGSVVYMFSSNALVLLSFAEWTGFIGVDTLLDVFQAYVAEFGSLSLMTVQFVAGGVLQCIGILSVLWIMYGERLKERFARRGHDGITG